MHSIKTIVQRCTAGAVLLITTLTFAFATPSSDIKTELDKARVNRETAHQLAEHARALGAEEDNYVIWFAKQQWSEWNNKVKELTAEYNKIVEEENSKGRYIGTALISAYTPDPAENAGYSVTADGTSLAGNEWKIVAGDNRYWKMGTKFYIDGVGVVTMRDTGGAIKGSNRFDLLVPYGQANAWGMQHRKVWVIE